jgi:predicted PurR-regulated permease PerM
MESDGVSKLIEHRWTIAVVAGVLLLILAIIYIALPLLDGIVLGVVFAYVGRPINNKLLKYTKLAPIATTVFIITPIILILGIGAIEIVNQCIWAIGHHQEITESLTSTIASLDIPEFIYTDVSITVENLASTAIGIAGQIPAFDYAKSITILVINFIISIFVCFFLVKDGARLTGLVKNLLPRSGLPIVDAFSEHADRILAGIFIGNLYVAIIASMTSLFVFYFFGVSHITAMASLVFLASLVPIFAGWMILAPIAISRYFEYGLENAILFYVVASIIIYGPTEVILRPYIVGIRSYTHPLLMMVMFIGGALVAGIAGFFLAPMAMGILIAVYRTYDDLMEGRIEVAVPDLLDKQQ